MRKTLFFTIFLILAISSFANDEPNREIYIEGTAVNSAQRQFFMDNFKEEAIGLNYPITENRFEAGYTFRFSVTQNMITYDDGTQEPAPPDEDQYMIKVSLIRNTDDLELIVFDFTFTELFEMYDFNNYLFYRAVSPYIQPLTDETLMAAVIDNSWRDKWLYLRLSFDYPITFYVLQQSSDLVGGIAAYAGDDINNPTYFTPLDHKILAMPGLTAGVEIQFLKMMSLEINFQIFLGDTTDNMFINLAAGAELRIPKIRLGNFMIEPYGAFSYPLSISSVFAKFPLFAVGGGIQVAVRGGKSGAFFVDAKFMMSFENAVMHNPFLLAVKGTEEPALAPNPEVINYKRYVIGLGVGYKFGLFDRK